MNETVIIWTALVPFLLLLWFSQRLSGLTGVSGLALAAVVSAAVVWFPWFGHPLPFWSASLSANFSVIMAGLLVVSVFDRAFETGIFRPRDWRAAWIFGAVASVLLYPSALGLGPQNFDAYALGWPWLFWPQSLILFGPAAVTAAWLIWCGNRFGLVLLLAFLGYAAGFQESENYWDYLLDPVYGAVSLVMILWMVWRRRTSGLLVPTSERSSGRSFR